MCPSAALHIGAPGGRGRGLQDQEEGEKRRRRERGRRGESPRRGHGPEEVKQRKSVKLLCHVDQFAVALILGLAEALKSCYKIFPPHPSKGLIID